MSDFDPNPARNLTAKICGRLNSTGLPVALLCLPLLLVFLTGCDAPVFFNKPCNPFDSVGDSVSCQAMAPATEATIDFYPNFDPSNALTITYDGQNITGLLTPPPAPKGESAMALPQPPSPNYYTSATHTLTANATCGWFCVYPTKTQTFIALNLAIGSRLQGLEPVGPLNVSLSTPLEAFLNTVPAGPYTTVQVTLSATPEGMVAFATSPQGPGSTSLSLPVNAFSTATPFYLKALGQRGSFTVSGTAAGVQQVQVSGTVE